jgi:hypothetical protein
LCDLDDIEAQVYNIIIAKYINGASDFAGNGKLSGSGLAAHLP